MRSSLSNFISSYIHIDNTLVWIHFPSLGMEYCNESVILILTKIVGNLTKYFVEIILDQPIVGRKWFKITYFT